MVSVTVTRIKKGKIREMECCEKCTTCYWYWQNNDTGNECNGDVEPCHEYKESEESLRKE